MHDAGEAEGFLSYVMPHIKGDTLRQRLQRENELPVADVVSIMHDVLDALPSCTRGVSCIGVPMPPQRGGLGAFQTLGITIDPSGEAFAAQGAER